MFTGPMGNCRARSFKRAHKNRAPLHCAAMSDTSDKANGAPGSDQGQSPDDLDPPDWPAIERHYAAGVLSVRAIGRKFGVSHTAIAKRATEYGWVRSAAPQIQARAQEMVARAEVAAQVATPLRPETPSQHEATIEASAEALALVLLGQRKDIKRGMGVVESMFEELERLMGSPELYGQLHMLLTLETKDSPAEIAGAVARDLAHVVESLPERARILKSLTESLSTLVSLQRESYGLSSGKASGKGEDGEPTAIVKDYTGVGSAESPGGSSAEDE